MCTLTQIAQSLNIPIATIVQYNQKIAEDYGLDGALPSCGGGGSLRVRVPIRASSPSRLVGTATMALPHPRVPTTAVVAATAPLVASKVTHPLHLNDADEIVRGAGREQRGRDSRNNGEDIMPRIVTNRLQTSLKEDKIESQNALAVVRKVAQQAAPTIEQLTPANATGLGTGASNNAARLSHFFTEVDKPSLEPDSRHASPPLLLRPRPQIEETVNSKSNEPQRTSREGHSNATTTPPTPAPAAVEMEVEVEVTPGPMASKPSDDKNNNNGSGDAESIQKRINEVSNKEQPPALPKHQQQGGTRTLSPHHESARALLKSIADAKREKGREGGGDNKRNSNDKGKSTFTNYFSSDALDLDAPRKNIVVVASPKKAKKEDEQEAMKKTSTSANISQSKSAVKIAAAEVPTRMQTLELRNPHIVLFENTVVNIVSDSQHQLNEKKEAQLPLVHKSVNTITVKSTNDKNYTTTNTDVKRQPIILAPSPPPNSNSPTFPTATLKRGEAPPPSIIKYVEEEDDESSDEEQHVSSVKPSKSDAFSSRIFREQTLQAQPWEEQLREERGGGENTQRKHRQGILLPQAPHAATFPSDKPLAHKTFNGEEMGDNIAPRIGRGRSIVTYVTTPCTREIMTKMSRKGHFLQSNSFEFRDAPMTIEELAVRYDVHPDVIYDVNEQTLCHGRLEHGPYTRGSTTYHFQEALPPGLVLRIPHNAEIS